MGDDIRALVTELLSIAAISGEPARSRLIAVADKLDVISTKVSNSEDDWRYVD